MCGKCLLSDLTENTFSLRTMKGVGVQSGFYYFNFSVNNRPEWTSTAAGQRFPQLLSLEVQSAAKLMVNRLLS